MPDITVAWHGSLCLVRPQSEPANTWITEHVDPDPLLFGGALVVEPRYLHDLLDGMMADGLSVEGETL